MLVSALLLAVLGSAPLSAAQIDKMLGWFPADTETLIVENQSGELSNPDGGGPLAKSVFSTGLVGIDDDTALPKSFSYNFVLEGFRKVQPPAELGLWPYEGCKIVGLPASEYLRLRAFVKKGWKSAGAMQGVQVFKLTERLEKDQWSFYAAFDGGRMYYATDKSYLTTVLTRAHGGSGGRCLPESLPEWKYIDKSLPFWAVRRLTPETLKLPYGADMGDKQLQGYAMWLDKDEKSFHAVSFSKNPHGFEIAQALWKQTLKNNKAAAFKVARIDSGTAQLTVDASAGDGSPAGFLIFCCLGHYVNV